MLFRSARKECPRPVPLNQKDLMFSFSCTSQDAQVSAQTFSDSSTQTGNQHTAGYELSEESSPSFGDSNPEELNLSIDSRPDISIDLEQKSKEAYAKRNNYITAEEIQEMIGDQEANVYLKNPIEFDLPPIGYDISSASGGFTMLAAALFTIQKHRVN